LAAQPSIEQWDKWWTNYSAFLVHYAEIAQEKDVELFCLGCEMNSSEQFEEHWRGLIAQVRDAYDGVLTYDINHGREPELAWWDAVDVISVSAYYEVPPPAGLAAENRGFCIHGKEAEAVVREWYAKPRSNKQAASR